MELPIPTSVVDQSLLTQFHMKMKGCFTIGQLYQRRFVTVYYQNFPPYPLKKVSDKQQGMLARVLAVTHIQTLKIVSYKKLGYGISLFDEGPSTGCQTNSNTGSCFI